MMHGALEPVRVSLVNVYSGEEIEVLANPTELQEIRRVGFAQHAVPGLSYRPAHYTGTENAQLRVTFWIDAHVAKERGGKFDVDGFANFCRSFTVPPVEGGEVKGPPPRLLFVWTALSMLCRVESLELTFREWSEAGELLRYDASFQLSEAVGYRRSSSDLRFAGGLA